MSIKSPFIFSSAQSLSKIRAVLRTVKNRKYNAVVIGAGPNGLAAAIVLAQKGLSVLLIEAGKTVGGGARSAEITLPGYIHDICSSIHPLAIGSPFFRTLPLARYGLEYIQPPASVAHPLENGEAVLLCKSIEETCRALGEDGKMYRKIFEPFVADWSEIAPDILAPLGIPRHPLRLAQFGLKALQSARGFAERYFQTEQARAVFAGCAAHSMLDLEKTSTAAFGMVLMISAHAVGWGFPRGGTQKIADALAEHFKFLGGEIEANRRIENIDEIPSADAILFDITPRQLLKIAGHRLPVSYRRRLERFQYGAGVFKMDFALSEPIPWKAKNCAQAATVHIGGSLAEIAAAEKQSLRGKIAEKPFVLLAQNSLFDATRAPENRHTAWAYCHVPNNFSVDMSAAVENQIERYAPGFRDCILAKNSLYPADLEKYNANYVGGDINGGAMNLTQLFTRPVAKINPYAMPAKGLYICSSSTPPGGGVHGMCGFHAARAVLKNVFSLE